MAQGSQAEQFSRHFQATAKERYERCQKWLAATKAVRKREQKENVSETAEVLDVQR